MSSKKQKKNSKEEEYKINPGHYLELMDRLHIVACNLDWYCLQHPLSEKYPDIAIRIEEALGTVFEAYQYVGCKEYENENELHGKKPTKSPKKQHKN